MDKKKGLGKSFKDVLSSPADWMFREDFQIFFCSVENLEPNPYQPRTLMDDEGLEELAASISERGVLQPLIVTKTDEPGRYTIVAGERRWRAAKKAGLQEVPVLLKDVASSDLVEIALVENIQRKDLTCIEEALAYERLQKEFGLSQEEIARKVGKSRPAVANTLRLLALPRSIQEDILNGRLSMGHARALAALSSEEAQLALRDEIIQKGLSVRAVESRVYGNGDPLRENKTIAPQKGTEARENGLIDSVENQLRSLLGMNVRIRRRGRTSGQVLIFFRSEEELNRLVERLKTIQSERGEEHEDRGH